ncbi:MAG: winged helix-turn-helix transcriptional regulator [Eubacterium sp.]|nr:winged helix-turn-helix transcriptional regulator [Eubacterium sp.]
MDSKKESQKLQSEFKECQKLLTAIGDETRQYLMSVMIMEKCGGSRVVDIAKKTHLSRPAVSHHMQILKDAGFVTSRKEGTMIYYSINADRDGLKKVRNLIDHIDRLLSEECYYEEPF